MCKSSLACSVSIQTEFTPGTIASRVPALGQIVSISLAKVYCVQAEGCVGAAN